MRSKYTTPGSRIRYYAVEFAPAVCPWARFRSQVLGATDPTMAAPSSIRGRMLAHWQELGLQVAPNTSDNGVHASASPFEGLTERMNWRGTALGADVFGKSLLAAGISESTIRAWSLDPLVPDSTGNKTSLFDLLENLDAGPCLERCVQLARVRTQ